MTLDEALAKPVTSVAAAARAVGLKPGTVLRRMRVNGMSLQQALRCRVHGRRKDNASEANLRLPLDHGSGEVEKSLGY